MGFFLKGKTDTQRQSTGSLIVIGFVVIAFMGYHIFPPFQGFCDRVFSEAEGALHMLYVAAGLFLCLFIYGHRGKSLLVWMGIILAVALVLWVGINFDMVWNAMVQTLGLWPTIILGLSGALIFYVLVRLIL